MTVWRGLRAAVLFGVAGSCAAQGCGESLPGVKRTIQSARYAIAFVTLPDPVPVGQHFIVAFAVCPRGNATMPDSVRVDATMPAHRHGMNYRPSVSSPQPGIYRGEGLMFHMPGRWDLTFDLVFAGATERLATTLHIE